ncbi:hypothetical protein NQ176_g3614 [Zarea fungicola]|uniref:Uncharacterized protein n=1 Tax=Zarea fungicola TaxID=93591 RepID=A0ACC1NJM8_9HYPO|nr:hypothetical protein NQ176_g3614 [Lecanicillium fungicola]
MNTWLLFILTCYCWIAAFANPILQNTTETTDEHFLTKSDFTCRSDRNPVVLVHGLLAANYELDGIAAFLREKGFCSYALTYGAYPGVPFIGGLKSVAESSKEIARFIKYVQMKTGADKIDLIGHSEGAMQVLYVPKFRGVSPIIEHIVAIAPPTHGVPLYGLQYLVPDFIWRSGMGVLQSLGCGACADMLRGGPAAKQLDDGTPIAQPGNKVTIIVSKFDQGVIPHAAASFVNEEGVNNIYVQDYCSLDIVGHFNEPGDKNIMNLILNALEDQTGRKFPCSLALPLR